MAKYGNTYQAGIDADKLANKYYDPQIEALEKERDEALSQLKLKYGL